MSRRLSPSYDTVDKKNIDGDEFSDGTLYKNIYNQNRTAYNTRAAGCFVSERPGIRPATVH